MKAWYISTQSPPGIAASDAGCSPAEAVHKRAILVPTALQQDSELRVYDENPNVVGLGLGL